MNDSSVVSVIFTARLSILRELLFHQVAVRYLYQAYILQRKKVKQ